MDHPLQRARARLEGHQVRIVFPEGDDVRIRQAANELVRAVPGTQAILLAKPDQHPTTPGVVFIDPDHSDTAEDLANLYVTSRPATALGVARRFVRKPMYHAGLMLKAGLADCMVAGVSARRPA
jgi:phosphotransacetylase